jgi:hypothetical protein
VEKVRAVAARIAGLLLRREYPGTAQERAERLADGVRDVEAGARGADGVVELLDEPGKKCGN